MKNDRKNSFEKLAIQEKKRRDREREIKKGALGRWIDKNRNKKRKLEEEKERHGGIKGVEEQERWPVF